MGIYDREYYRGEGAGGFLGALSGRGQVCKYLIVANIVVFLLELMAPREFTEALLLDARAVMDGQVWRLLTYAFLHDPTTPWHILFNMLFLWWFGQDVEDMYGPREFLVFYLTAAVLGGVAFLLYSMSHPEARFCIGASGAVTAVLVLCALHYPNRRILLWFFVPIPIWVFVAFQVLQDTFLFLSADQSTTTAFTVHLAGAAFGFLYFKGQWRLSGFWTRLQEWQRERARPRLRVYRGEPQQPVSVAAPPAGEVDEHLEAKLDAVLEKVARHGQSSLTESERQILFRASEIYKRRRS